MYAVDLQNHSEPIHCECSNSGSTSPILMITVYQFWCKYNSGVKNIPFITHSVDALMESWRDSRL